MEDLSLFWRVNISNILTFISLLLGGAYFVSTLKVTVKTLSERMLKVEESLQKLVGILIEQGKQEERIRLISERVQAQGIRLDEAERRINRMSEVFLRNRQQDGK